MLIEIEVSELEIKQAIERHIRSAIADKVNAWGSAQYVKDAVSAAWSDAVKEIIDDVVSDHATIKEQVNAAMVRKIQGQLTAALSKTGK